MALKHLQFRDLFTALLDTGIHHQLVFVAVSDFQLLVRNFIKYNRLYKQLKVFSETEQA